ncbi:MAG TPA: YceI family protein [Polyangia bacterium]|nr:YceI family protein [Polyangia bacterium]
MHEPRSMNTDNSSAPLLSEPAGRGDGATQQEWLIDVQRSTLAFSLRHIVVQRIHGRFDRWGGSLFFDRAQPSQSSLELWVDLASITTGDDERDAHVRSAEFLDVKRFPRAFFHSGLVEVRGSDVIVNGRLELRGVVHDVQVNVEIGAPAAGSDGRVRAPATARATINRQSFGLHWNQDLDVGGIVVGDEIDIRATVEMVRADDVGSSPGRR